MAEESTLLAHLVPKLTGRVEDTATDALAFILNKSAACREVLDQLLQEGGFVLEPIVRVKTQVTYQDDSKPDMTGYDRNGVERLFLEAKFWAALQPTQAKRYFEQLQAAGPGVLLFVAPRSRIETLWPEIRRQMESSAGSLNMEITEAANGTRRAKVAGSENRLMLVSWDQLLGSMAISAAADTRVTSDIQQLQGLASLQDAEAFLPVHPAEFGPALPRRIQGLRRLIDDVVSGRGDGWLVKMRRGAIARGYSGRYFKFSGVERRPGLDDRLALTVHYERWAASGDTPLWLWIGAGVPVNVGDVRARFPLLVELSPQDGICEVPIHLPTGVEYEAVLDDVIQQIRTVRDMVKTPPSMEP